MAATNLVVGKKAPEFCLPDKNGNDVCLRDYKGKNVILYFYPKDNSPSCTTEAIGFTNILPELLELNAEVIGISPDNPESHKKFIEKKNLKITLLSDEDTEVLKKYGAWAMKKFRGKSYMGVIRSTYLINKYGNIEYHWPKVSVKGHPEDVKEKLSKVE